MRLKDKRLQPARSTPAPVHAMEFAREGAGTSSWMQTAVEQNRSPPKFDLSAIAAAARYHENQVEEARGAVAEFARSSTVRLYSTRVIS
jgi:hypothetical protein